MADEAASLVKVAGGAGSVDTEEGKAGARFVVDAEASNLSTRACLVSFE